MKLDAALKSARILLALAMVSVSSIAQGAQSAAPDETTPVDAIIAAGTDLLGEAALRRQDGPSYDFFAKAMPPLRYVNSEFLHYPIVLAAPRNASKARLVSNGSAINAKGGGEPWRDVGFPVSFRVGANAVVFGDDLSRLDGPRLADGYLPLVEMGYREGDATYRQETFASVGPALADCAVVFVRFTLTAGKDGQVSARIEPAEALHLDGSQLSDGAHRAYVRFSSAWQWNPESHTLTASITANEDAVLAIFTKPDAGSATSSPLSLKVYSEQRQRCITAWQRLLERGVKLDVPETIVNNAWRSVLASNFAVVTGDTVNYSAGNAYETEYITEGSRTVGAFMLFGLFDEARPMLVSLLKHSIPEHKYAVTGWKLRALAQYYWLTRDAVFLREHRSLWEPLIPLIIDALDAETGLTPKDFYATDIARPVWNLKTNATCWRGLRDVAAVLREIGEPNPQLEERVKRYRSAILDAVDKSVQRDFDPPFVPNILLSHEEKPYAALTATALGSYWCLVSNAVLDSGLFDAQPEKAAWICDTLRRRGGVCMGMLRFDQHAKLFANERGVDDNYTTGYAMYLLKHDDADRALVSLYGKLAQGFTRNTFVGGEGTSLDALDAYGRPMYLPPCTAGNAFFLWTLRNTLVQDWDTDDDGKPDTLRLLYATPRQWLRDGAAIRFENAPTAFGPVSIEAKSTLSQGEVIVNVSLPPQRPKHVLLRARLPGNWKAVSADVTGTARGVDHTGVVDLSDATGDVTIHFLARNETR